MSDGKVIRAFVVDDERVIASTVAMILNMSGFSASAFFSAEEAIAVADENGPPNLLITDVAMPGMNGIDLAIRFEEQHPSCKVLLFSGQAVTGHLLDVAKDQGHNFTLLTKPVHPTDLLAAINDLGVPQSAD
jgi:DNA-binding NtrC family response regulator